MSSTINPILLYLKKENITIDESEFEFQVSSHPDYPSLLSLVDALNFFSIENGAFQLEFDQIEQLPNLFIALLKVENEIPELFFVEQKKGSYFYTNNDKVKSITKETLKSQWLGTILLLDAPEAQQKQTKKNKWLFPSIITLIFAGVLLLFENHWANQLFFIFPVLGILSSVAVLKDLFGTKSELINSFCNLTATTSCNTIVNSKKWKIFEIISFSDLSIVFFGFQFMGLLAFMVSGNASVFLATQKVLLLGSIPVILASLYFQKFVEKKWCPICLVIIAVVLAELSYLFFTIPFNFTIFTPNTIILLSFVFTSVTFIWIALKKMLVAQKESKDTQLKNNRFIRNYKVFKNNLLADSKKDLPNSTIVLGNKQSFTNITVVTNPFCGHCKNIHEILDKILERQTENIQIKVILKTDLKNQSEENAQLFRNLYYLGNKNTDMFSTALKEWFDKKNIKEWLQKYELDKSNTWDGEIEYHNNLCELNGIDFTPAIFINGYAYPQLYEREHLEHFVNELVEDNF
jgi:glutaredoxin/uncharacterized membrane protein